MAGHVHRYFATVAWEGSTRVGYDAYVRDHDGATPPATAPIALSGDAALKGNGERSNPEQLLVLAAASCQMLSFLARAARARIELLAYADAAEGEMSEDEAPMWISSILLRPRMTFAPGTDLERARHLVMRAHEDCYIANSLKTNVVIEPELLVAGE
jgi:organic hydroperoxide reductase OsmC/OhrA